MTPKKEAKLVVVIHT